MFNTNGFKYAFELPRNISSSLVSYLAEHPILHGSRSSTMASDYNCLETDLCCLNYVCSAQASLQLSIVWCLPETQTIEV